MKKIYFFMKKSQAALMLLLTGVLILPATIGFGQLPDANSCTSKDLLLVGASLPPAPGEDECACGGTRTLMLTIDNKTGSLRTSFALWGILKIYNRDGSLKSSEDIFACAGPIPPSAITTLPSDKTITFECGESLVITDLFLAWTTANKKETCEVLFANPGSISPKCGTLPQIKVVAGVDAEFDVTDATCLAGGSIKVSPYGGVGPYLVAVDGGTYQTVLAGGSYTFSNLSAGSHDFSIMDSRNCEETKSRTIASPAGVTANAGADFTKTCTTNPNGKQIGEASETGYTYSWSPADGLSDASTSNPTADPSSTTTYTVTKTYTATGCTGTDDVTVTVNTTAPTANAGSDVTINCTAPSTTLAATGGVSYSWSPAEGLSDPNISNPTATPEETTTYVVTVTGANGCTATDDVMVTVDKAAPAANAGSDVTINCTTPSATLAASGGVSYSWSPAEGLSDPNISNPTATPEETTTYVVTVTGANGCTATDDVMVTVDKAAPAANAGSDVTINCTTPSATLAASGGVSYSWSPTEGLSNPNISNPTATPEETTTYVVTVTGANGCTATDDVKVTVDKTAPAANAGSDVTINCTSPSTTLAASGGVSYSWSPTEGLSDPNISNPTATPEETTTYVVTVTGANGCTATDDVMVTVDKAAPAANAGSDVTINCTTPSATLAASGGVSYSWSPTEGLSDPNISNPTATPEETTTYVVTVTGANGCTATDDVKVTVDKAAPAANAGSDVTINCTTPSATLAASGGVSYSWSPTEGLSNPNISNPTATPEETTTYVVTVTGANGCTATDDVKVTVEKTNPTAPTICVVQPSLCGPSTGSITILAPLGTEYEYSIDDGDNWQTSPDFNDLAAGSVTGIRVKDTNTGCISNAADCADSNCEYQPTAEIASTPMLKSATIEEPFTEELSVKAYPNPFSDQVKFEVSVPEAGEGSLELVNMMGQKVKTVYQGYLRAGISSFEVSLPAKNSSTLIYLLRMGNKQLTGKLLQLNP